MGSDGSGADEIKIPAGGSVKPATVMSVASEQQHTIRMNGRAVLKFGNAHSGNGGAKCSCSGGSDIRHGRFAIPHQTNKRIIESAARSMGIPNRLS